MLSPIPRRRLGAVVLPLALAAVPAAGAHAAQIEKTTLDGVGPVIVYQASAGTTDKVDLYQQDGKIIFGTIAGDAPLNTQTCFQIPGHTGEIQCEIGDAVAVIVVTEDGNDTINGSTGNTPVQLPMVISGGAGNDQITGGTNDDVMGGEDGEDTINDSAGSDQMDGGPGNDRFWSGDASPKDEVLGGDGIDDAVFKRSQPFTVSLNGQADDGIPTESDNYQGVENLGVSDGGATFIGDDGPNKLYSDFGGGNNRFEGRGGNDVLKGGQGNDELLGADGDDQMIGEDGDDTLDGGAGKDAFIGDRQNFTYLEGVGADTILARDGVMDSINCGPGGDRAVLDQLDVAPTDPVTACESIDQAPFGGGTPGGGVPGGTPTPGGTGTTPPPAGKPAPKRLTVAAKRRSGKVAVSGKLTLPAGVAASACKGAKVTITLRAGNKVAGRGSARLSGSCAYKATVKATRKGKLKVTAQFAGNAALAGLATKPAVVR